jgi:iron complex transport system substrate-binding protein
MEYPSMFGYKSAPAILTILLISFLISTTRAETGFPLTVTDDFGRNVTISAPPTRIVSTAPSNTEILFALGLGDRVVGVTKYCDWPPLVLERVRNGQLSVIGGYADPSLEGVVSLNPDLVLVATDLQFEFVSVLQNRGIVVVALNPKNMSGVIYDIGLVGTICGKATEANRLIENLQNRISYVDNRVAGGSTKPKVYYELWYDPLMSFGGNTVFDELVAKAGGQNIFHNTSMMYPTASSEIVIQKDPEIIVVAEGYMGGFLSSDFEKRSGWGMIKAVKEGKVYTIDENLIVRTGPRIIEGLENLASIIHPELFTGTINYNSSISVTSNATIFALIYDDSRSLLNFSLIGREGTASVRVNIEKKFLKGTPIVLVDGVEKVITVSENQQAFTIDFTSDLSTRQVVIGGSQTIPEFGQGSISGILVLTVFIVLAGIVFNKTKRCPKGQGSLSARLTI